ncbi:hypothetical protein THUN1379_21010 [Paludibacterium sp. THUN1379]|nr:hypothetical protein THUN1379_21010 [Paludibacterium sp. THUN1379]
MATCLLEAATKIPSKCGAIQFAGSDTGGERAVAMYRLIETAKLNGLDPEAYLCQVFHVIADHSINRGSELLP